jgi:hypothetical protein
VRVVIFVWVIRHRSNTLRCFWTMARTTQSHGYIPPLSMRFTKHAMALLKRRHNYPPNTKLDTITQLDGNLKIEEVRRIRREVRDTFPDVSTSTINKIDRYLYNNIQSLRRFFFITRTGSKPYE